MNSHEIGPHTERGYTVVHYQTDRRGVEIHRLQVKRALGLVECGASMTCARATQLQVAAAASTHRSG